MTDPKHLSGDVEPETQMCTHQIRMVTHSNGDWCHVAPRARNI